MLSALGRQAPEAPPPPPPLAPEDHELREQAQRRMRPKQRALVALAARYAEADGVLHRYPPERR